jgi:chemotaxis response regulator CheB
MKKTKSQNSSPENGSALKSASENFLVVGIGASAGGIQALQGIF